MTLEGYGNVLGRHVSNIQKRNSLGILLFLTSRALHHIYLAHTELRNCVTVIIRFLPLKQFDLLVSQFRFLSAQENKIIGMGGGGVMRAAAAAKVVGVTAANGGFRGYALDHPVCAAVRPAAASAISSACDDVRGVRSAPDIPAAAEGMSVPKPILEFDDWGFSDEEESPPARLVFGSAPTLQEAKEATSDLKQAIDK